MARTNFIITWFTINVACTINIYAKSYTPVVIWHGNYDTCCYPNVAGVTKFLIEQEMPGTYVVSIEVGRTTKEDYWNALLMDLNYQVEIKCQELSKDKALRNGYIGIGYSQGGLALRGILQRCKNPPMKKFITLGSPHQGIFGMPHQEETPETALISKLVSEYSYSECLQQYFSPSQYWHDPYQEEVYKKHSRYLADINNELSINMQYKSKIEALELFVMGKFIYDSHIKPRDSEWFSFYKPNQTTEIIPLFESKIYTEDRLGLRKLHEEDRLHFISIPWDHMEFTNEWFIENIINKYLK